MKIMILDDEKQSRMALAQQLHLYGDCFPASDCEAALAEFKAAHEQAAPYNLIFTELEMPSRSGHEVLHEIREFETAHKLAPIRAVMVTRTRDNDNILHAFSEGVEVYVIKPFKPEQMASVLDDLGLEEQF